jgi:L-alanine-DL-glutamate epimerase-like enolase superfamily enzyme
VSWFEEPVSSDRLYEMHLVRDRAPAGMEIAAGEYGYDSQYFRSMLDARAADVIQTDATRYGGFIRPKMECLGPDESRPGLGLTLKRQDAQRFAA